MKQWKFKYQKQYDSSDCGAACLKMIANYHGKSVSANEISRYLGESKLGVSLYDLSVAAERMGFRSLGLDLSIDQLISEVNLPCIVHWKENHFLVVVKATKRKIYVADPAFGKIVYSRSEFIDGWRKSGNNNHGVCLILEPTPLFYSDDGADRNNTEDIWNYIYPHRKLIFQFCAGMFIGSILQILFPFITQSIVDFGINTQNIDFVVLILIAQSTLVISSTLLDIVQGWLMIQVSSRINISIVSDFLAKILQLPIPFFESKLVGDLMQRVSDLNRIESFFTSTLLTLIFSFFNAMVFAAFLFIYEFKIFIVFVIGSIIHVTWVYFFMKRRKRLDYKRFSSLSENQNLIAQMFMGIHEIKLYNYDKKIRGQWKLMQARLVALNIKSLYLSQSQNIGTRFIGQLKNVLITLISASAVIHGEITLGMMIAIQYFVAQVNGPIEQLMSFMNSLQDAKISLDRRMDVMNKSPEQELDINSASIKLTEESLLLENVHFKYDSNSYDYTLEDINVKIPFGKLTAIVGHSGSGKTSLLKLLLGFYKPNQGKIKIGDVNLNNINLSEWRNYCGAVMQEGYIFSTTVAENIALSEHGNIDYEAVIHAMRIANIEDYVNHLPKGMHTKLGRDGQGVSQGQKQRILIARAIYKKPSFLFLDEATNALDSSNESKIISNLKGYGFGKTIIVIAHRLSTVKNADQIIVLNKGKAVEIGDHNSLIRNEGIYYSLIKNQLSQDRYLNETV